MIKVTENKYQLRTHMHASFLFFKLSSITPHSDLTLLLIRSEYSGRQTTLISFDRRAFKI